MTTPHDPEHAWREADAAWRAHPTPETERAVEHAADALRRARRATWAAEGVTDANLRERHPDDDDAT